MFERVVCFTSFTPEQYIAARLLFRRCRPAPLFVISGIDDKTEEMELYNSVRNLFSDCVMLSNSWYTPGKLPDAPTHIFAFEPEQSLIHITMENPSFFQNTRLYADWDTFYAPLRKKTGVYFDLGKWFGKAFAQCTISSFRDQFYECPRIKMDSPTLLHGESNESRHLFGHCIDLQEKKVKRAFQDEFERIVASFDRKLAEEICWGEKQEIREAIEYLKSSAEVRKLPVDERKTLLKLLDYQELGRETFVGLAETALVLNVFCNADLGLESIDVSSDGDDLSDKSRSSENFLLLTVRDKNAVHHISHYMTDSR